MTYCVALRLDDGLVMLADTRTNAGVDNVAKFRKMFTWSAPNDRVIACMTSGNLAVTQAVVSQLQEDLDAPDTPQETLFTAKNMFGVAEVVGEAMRSVQGTYGPGLAAMGESSGASVIVGGQVKGEAPRLFLVYSAGNFIEATEDTPFFQIGEHKYGRPLLDRIIATDTSLEDGITAVLLSMASTIKSNLTVGMPLDLAVARTDALTFEQYRRIEADDESFYKLTNAFSDALIDVFQRMRAIEV